MKMDNNHTINEKESDEIDLIDLLLQLWQAKWLIFFFTLSGLVISATVSVYSPQKWISTATLTRPDSAQIASYTFAIGVLDGRPAFDARDVESRLINRFATTFSALAETLRNRQHPETLTLEPAIKGQPLPLKLSYQASSSVEAQSQLTQYINQTNTQIAQELTADLQENLEQKIASLNSLLDAQEKIAQEQKDLRIAQIKEALKFAEAAEIIHPRERQGDNTTQDTLFLLGTEALSAMVKRESMRPLAYPEAYFKIRQQLLAIEAIESDKVSISTYRYILKPTLPIRRDSPKTTLLLVLGLLLGGMVGCGVVLVRNTVRDYQTRRALDSAGKK